MKVRYNKINFIPKQKKRRFKMFEIFKKRMGFTEEQLEQAKRKAINLAIEKSQQDNSLKTLDKIIDVEKTINNLTRKVYEKEIKFIKDNVDKFEKKHISDISIFSRLILPYDVYSYKNYKVFNGKYITIDGIDILLPELAKELFDYIEDYQKYKNNK